MGSRRGLALRLVKRIPVAAGLGGGSSDAAGTLRALRRLLAPDLSDEELSRLAAELGADVPFFLGPPAARGQGRGEALRPVPSPRPGWLVVLTPEFGLSTASVYGAVRVPEERERRTPEALLAALGAGVSPAPHLFNRLEEAAAVLEPRVTGLRERLAGHLAPGEGLLLSGSGSSFFLPAADFPRAAHLAGRFREAGRAVCVRTLSHPTPIEEDG